MCDYLYKSLYILLHYKIPCVQLAIAQHSYHLLRPIMHRLYLSITMCSACTAEQPMKFRILFKFNIQMPLAIHCACTSEHVQLTQPAQESLWWFIAHYDTSSFPATDPQSPSTKPQYSESFSGLFIVQSRVPEVVKLV